MIDRIEVGDVLYFASDPVAWERLNRNQQNALLCQQNQGCPVELWPPHALGETLEVYQNFTGDLARVRDGLGAALRPAMCSIFRCSRPVDVAPDVIGADQGNLGRSSFDLNVDILGYRPNHTTVIESVRTVFSAPFSGCLMVEYVENGNRHVAHVATVERETDRVHDTRVAFRDHLQEQGRGVGANFGWFRPNRRDELRRKTVAFQWMNRKEYERGYQFHYTFGVITDRGEAYSIDAFRPLLNQNPTGIDRRRLWMVTGIARQQLSRQNW